MRRKTETKIKEVTVSYMIPVLYQSTVICIHKLKVRLYYSTTYNAIPKVSTGKHDKPEGIIYTYRDAVIDRTVLSSNVGRS